MDPRLRKREGTGVVVEEQLKDTTLEEIEDRVKLGLVSLGKDFIGFLESHKSDDARRKEGN